VRLHHQQRRTRPASRFSVNIFEIGTRLLVKKDKDGKPSYKDFADLKGKNVVTTAGTTSERIIKAMNADKQMGMNVISAKDHGESFQMLESGRAVAFMMDDALLAGEEAKAKKPDDWVITGTPQSFEIYAAWCAKTTRPSRKRWMTPSSACTSPAKSTRSTPSGSARSRQRPEPQLPDERQGQGTDRQPERQTGAGSKDLIPD
jgi:hypothetical protein